MKKHIKKIWKNFLGPLLLFIVMAGSVLMWIPQVSAQASTPSGTTPSGPGTGYNEATNAITSIGGSGAQGIGLPNFATTGHSNSAIQPGASSITSAIYYGEDFVKYVMGTIAVLTIIISGVRLVLGGKGTEEVAQKQKEHLKYAIIGLVVIMVADFFVQQVFFGAQGEIYGSQSTIQQAAQAGSAEIQGIYNVILYFAGAVAILMIVIAGFRYVTSGGNEETMGKAKKQIIYAVIGLMLAGIAEFSVQEVIFPNQGSQLSNVQQAQTLIVNITNFVAGFISTIAGVMLIYGGYLYVTAFGNEEATGKAKKVFIGAIVGLLLAMGAYALVNTTIKLENQVGTTSNTTTPGTTAPASLPTNGTVGP